MSGETLGTFKCDGCGEHDAVIRKRKNSRFYYTHCPECKTDQRTGKKRQAFLASIVKGEALDLGGEAAKNDGDEWKPTVDTHKTMEHEGEPEAETRSSVKSEDESGGMSRTFKIVAGTLLTLATFVGAVAVKGGK